MAGLPTHGEAVGDAMRWSQPPVTQSLNEISDKSCKALTCAIMPALRTTPQLVSATGHSLTLHRAFNNIDVTGGFFIAPATFDKLYIGLQLWVTSDKNCSTADMVRCGVTKDISSSDASEWRP